MYIQRASYSIFVTLSLLLTCVGSFVAALFNPVVCFVLLAVIMCQLILLLLVTLVVSRKY